MARIACAVALIFAVIDCADQLHARQASPSFEVASVRRGQPPDDPILVVAGSRRGDSWVANDATLRMLVRAAYAPQFQTQGTIIGGPDWIDTVRFDIIGRLGPSVSTDTMRLTAQALLAERFTLVVHRESRELPVSMLCAELRLLTFEPGNNSTRGRLLVRAAPPHTPGRIPLRREAASNGRT